MSLLPVVVAVVGFVAAVAVGRAVSARRLGKVLPAFEPGTARVAGLLAPRAEGVVSGFRFAYRPIPRSNNSPGGARATAWVSAVPCRFEASRMGPGGAVLLRLGLVRDIEIGDPELDRGLRFSAREETVLRSVFGGESAREALRRLAATPHFRSVAVRDDRVVVIWAPRDPAHDEDPAGVRARLMAVVELLSALGVAPSLGGR